MIGNETDPADRLHRIGCLVTILMEVCGFGLLLGSGKVWTELPSFWRGMLFLLGWILVGLGLGVKRIFVA